ATSPSIGDTQPSPTVLGIRLADHRPKFLGWDEILQAFAAAAIGRSPRRRSSWEAYLRFAFGAGPLQVTRGFRLAGSHGAGTSCRSSLTETNSKTGVDRGAGRSCSYHASPAHHSCSSHPFPSLLPHRNGASSSGPAEAHRVAPECAPIVPDTRSPATFSRRSH